MKTIFNKLTRELEYEIDKMPYSLTKRQFKRLVNKALDKVVKKVGKQYGISNVDSVGVKEVFWNCRQSFPDFDDEAYLSMMQGSRGNSITEIGRYEYINTNRTSERMDFTNEILFDGEWGAKYNLSRHEMLGGYSENGETFHPDFRIRNIKEDDMPTAIALCSMLYAKYGKIDTTFEKLQKEFCEVVKDL